MPIFTDNDLIDLLHNNAYKYDNSGKTPYYYGLLHNFDGLDINEYLKIVRSQSGSSSIDYWDTVPYTDISGITYDGPYPDYDIKDGIVVIEKYPANSRFKF